jgi:hypothetical protein
VLLAAEQAPPGPGWLAITLACLAAVATLTTAAMPYLVEKTKQRNAKPTPEPATPAATTEAVERADKALSLIEDSMRDLRQQRDQAETEVRRLHRLLARRETELRRRGWVE